LVGQSQPDGPPIAGTCQSGDGFELRWKDVLNGDQRRKRRRIGLRFDRQAAESVFAAPTALVDFATKRFEVTHRQRTVVGGRERVQPLVKRYEIDVRL